MGREAAVAALKYLKILVSIRNENLGWIQLHSLFA